MKCILAARGMDVILSTGGAHLVELAKRESPAMVFIDAEMPGVDAARTARILRRCRETAATRFIACHGSEVAESLVDTLQAAGVKLRLVRPLSRDAVMGAIDQAMKEHEVLRAALPPAWSRTVHTQRVESNNSLLVRDVCCPFHDDPVQLQRYILRTGQIVTEVDYFDLTVYKAPARKDIDFVDFNLLAVMVCPSCWFATNDPGYLIDRTEGARRHVIAPGTKNAILADQPNREQIAQAATELMFSEQRPVDQAIVAYRLAVESSLVIREQNRYGLPIESLRLANYHLRLRRLLQQTGHSDYEAECEPALKWLTEAFSTVDAPGLFKAAYQLVALSIRNGDNRTAFQYIARLKEMQQDVTLDKSIRNGAERYLNRCQSIWEDRDLHRAGQTPSTLAA